MSCVVLVEGKACDTNGLLYYILYNNNNDNNNNNYYYYYYYYLFIYLFIYLFQRSARVDIELVNRLQ